MAHWKYFVDMSIIKKNLLHAITSLNYDWFKILYSIFEACNLENFIFFKYKESIISFYRII